MDIRKSEKKVAAHGYANRISATTSVSSGFPLHARSAQENRDRPWNQFGSRG